MYLDKYWIHSAGWGSPIRWYPDFQNKNIMFRKTLIAFVTLALLAGCSKDKPGSNGNPVIINIDRLTSIVTGDNGIIWIGTNSGLLGYDGTNWKLFTPSGQTGTPALLSDLAFDGTGIWMATMAGAVYAEMSSGNILVTTAYSRAFTGSDTVSCINVDHLGIRWFATPIGISAKDGESWPPVTHFYGPAIFSSYPVTSIGVVNDTCYAGTQGGGLVRYIRDADGVSGASALWPSNGCGLNDNVIHCLFTDNTDNLWIGMPSGVQKHVGSNPFITGTNWVLYTTAAGLVNDDVTAITQDQDGSMWFGTGAGISRFDGMNWTSFTVADGLADDSIADLTAGVNNNIWAITDTTLSHYDGSGWSPVEIPTSFSVNK